MNEFDDYNDVVDRLYEERDRDAQRRSERSASWSADLYEWESRAELDAAEAINKALGDNATLSKGENLRTQIGAFRPDLVIRSKSRRIGIEIDGKAFHTDSGRDLLRDAAILKGLFLDAIYRVSAARVWYRCDDFVYILSRYEPTLFSHRMFAHVLPRLASAKARSLPEYPPDGVSWHEIGEPDDSFDGTRRVGDGVKFFRLDRYSLNSRSVLHECNWIDQAVAAHGPMSFQQAWQRRNAPRSGRAG